MEYLSRIKEVTLRSEPILQDRENIRGLLSSAGVFNAREIDVAIELIDDRIEKGNLSEYSFLFAELNTDILGYISYGPITLTENRFDIYWICVGKNVQQGGVGSMLISNAEHNIIGKDGYSVFVETSSKVSYKPAREFYKKHGYVLVASVP
ncbi:MAG: GNAT family N-acetyltransferase, partial [Candidatus Magnetoovum sp. WYHC-5]|nr:GNAT family N-acetyltransferase [Candidatus Magnetoovum sp. WYHC-5]